MRGTCPLPDTHPELSVLEAHDLCREYRVENWHLAHDGSGRVIRGTVGFTWVDAAFVIFAGVFWKPSHTGLQISLVLAALLLAYRKCTQVLWESVLVFPSHGIQLETHRGFPSYHLLASRRFIPLSELQDFIINEGLRGWDVRYYLACLYKPPDSPTRLAVAYENILPRFPVLREIYVGAHAYLQTGIEDHNETA